jgi:glycine betaine/choline ABC-type transport system substrate-binding protein
VKQAYKRHAKLNYAVDGKKLTPKQAAENWLKEKSFWINKIGV